MIKMYNMPVMSFIHSYIEKKEKKKKKADSQWSTT